MIEKFNKVLKKKVMNKKKVIIIDDERLARVELKNLLTNFSNITIVGEGANAEEGIQLIESLQPDLIFLDIQMPEQSGFDMLEEIPDPPSVIFVTAYDEYAIKAFEFNALDYILKPINTDRLREAIDRVFEKDKGIEKEVVVHQEEKPFQDEIYLKDGNKSYFVNLMDISLFSSFGNYVKVHFHEKSILIHRSLNQIEKRTSERIFFRANRYSIINVKQIKEIRQGLKGKLKFILLNDQEIECSERKSVLFRERWGV